MAEGTKCDRSADAPGEGAEKYKQRNVIDHLHGLLQRHRGGRAHRAQAALLQESGTQRQPADACRGGGGGERVGELHDVRSRKLTRPSAHAHSAAAAPTYFSADTARPSSAHHQFAVRSSERNAGTVLMNGNAT